MKWSEHFSRWIVEATDPIDYRRETGQHAYEEYRRWGVSAQEAAEALWRISTSWGESTKAERDAEERRSEGIALCGYGEL